jgi:hypothetical protein
VEAELRSRGAKLEEDFARAISRVREGSSANVDLFS